MTWLTCLYNAHWVTGVAVSVTVLYSIYPAYKRTRSLALLLLGYAYLINAFLLICDQTIGRGHMTRPEYMVYRTLRQLTGIVDSVLFGGSDDPFDKIVSEGL